VRIKAQDAASLFMAAAVVLYIAEEWSHGAISRWVRSLIVAPVLSRTADEVPPGWISALHEESRKITKEGSST
jgi:hypothetical protein